MEPIAVIGISCEFGDGIHSGHSLWDTLKSNADISSEMISDQIKLQTSSLNLSNSDLNRTNMIGKHGYLLDNELLNRFDANFFGVSALQAQKIDVEDRLLLEKFVHLLEDADYTINRIAGTKTAVFIGQHSNKHESTIINQSNCTDTHLLPSSLSKCSASVRLAYHFDLRGPNFTIDTTRSSSLETVVLAVEALRIGDADYAVIGGTNIFQISENFLYDTCIQSELSNTRRNFCCTEKSGYEDGKSHVLICNL
ncbi:unnamed protein product [Adineta ricciae]|uniref:Ketosynthase family 3 (KS3) domain-containing protein n=1 Tax=Adineta ricciae TaxID=249248 RepID=A0A815XMY2_ADIRI|nr:unnamed protein product [Adineta ricciae]CAF1559824.1 unnamed protein product [Adineta ricciae]